MEKSPPPPDVMSPTGERPNNLGMTNMADSNNSDDEPVFKLDVGGKSFWFRKEVVLLHRDPTSLLPALIRSDHRRRLLLADDYHEVNGEYYFERNSKIAAYVLDYYLTGVLHRPQDVCLERFRAELRFWRLTNVQLAPCCALLADDTALKETLEMEKELDEITCLPECRKIAWHLMEDPSSSIFAKLFSVVSISFIFASIAGLILGSMPEFQKDNHHAEYYHLNLYRGLKQQRQQRPLGGLSDGQPTGMLANHPKPHFANPTGNSTSSTIIDFVYKPTDDPQQWLVTLEYVCIAWFTGEYAMRFLIAPSKGKFLRKLMNLIDIFTFLPFFFELALSSIFGISAERLKEITGAMLVVRVLRVLRMARVFKLARYSTGLQVFGNTLRSSLRELCMLSSFLVTGTVFFSTIIYFLEKDEVNTDFSSIPAACWWCIITVTTVGYGDCQILTAAGKVVAAVASIFGIIILAFPISMVVENFAFAQQQSQVEAQIREAQMAVVANDYLLRRYPTQRRARQLKKSREEPHDPLLCMSGLEHSSTDCADTKA